ncbi:hypothetical protein V8E51_014780 [Hyaloscypha variabilis]
MSYGQSYRSLLEHEPRRDGTYLLNGQEIPLEDFEPAYLPPSNDNPGSHRTPSPPEPAPSALDERLYDELYKGVYECPICTDPISLDNQMWSCKDCHHIYHFPCAREWALKRKGSLAVRTWRWPCPTCKRLQTGGDAMTPACWCGRWRHHHVEVIGNSCGRKCTGYNTCESPGAKCERFCQKLCHPGPCEPVVCVPSCTLVRFPHFKTGKKPVRKNVHQTPQPPPRARALRYGPSRRELELATMRYRAQMEREAAADARRAERRARARARAERRADPDTLEDGETCSVILMLCILAAIETGMWYWIKHHVDRWLSPLQYIEFTDHTRGTEFSAGIVVGCIILTLIKGAVTFCAFYHVGKCIVYHLGLPHMSFGRFLVRVLMLLATVACFIDFPVAYLAGPGILWNAQMGPSCQGFDTRVKLDGIYGDSLAASQISLYDPLNSLKNQTPVPHTPNFDTFTLTKKGVEKHAKFTPEPFTTYHRLSGAYTPSSPLLIDFDLAHHTWRILTPSTSSHPSRLLRNGTWTEPTKSNPHSYFPELDLQATNLHFYGKNCVYQPFVTVFRTEGMSDEEVKEQSGRVWESGSEGNVVMRTASFGKGQKGLEVCGRRGEYEVLAEGRTERRRGLEEDVVVPLGLLAVTRRQMKIDRKLKGDCWWGKD